MYASLLYLQVQMSFLQALLSVFIIKIANSKLLLYQGFSAPSSRWTKLIKFLAIAI